MKIHKFSKVKGDLSLAHGVESSEYESKAKANEKNIVVPECQKVKTSYFILVIWRKATSGDTRMKWRK